MAPTSWRSFLPPEEARLYDRVGYGRRDSIGARPALLVVDCTIAFTGRSADLSIDDAVREFPTACGPSAWQALPHITSLLDHFRGRARPIVFTRSNTDAALAMGRATKAGRQRDPERMAAGNYFPDEVKPEAGEWVLEKGRASAFFGTPLATYLITHGVDSLLVAGATTSGCVRASVVDAFSYGFVTFVVEEACFDRSPTAHCANLFDMDAKYASVVSITDIVEG